MCEKKIAVIEGDGIGPEIVEQAKAVLEKIAFKYSHKFTYNYCLMGGIAVDKTGVPLPQETIDICKNADAVLLGAVGGKKWDSLPTHLRPETGLLGIRKALNLFTNIRPSKLFSGLSDASPLSDEIIQKGLDFMIVRELTGGAYFGEKRTFYNEKNQKTASDLMIYSDYEIERICRVAFSLAEKRRGVLHSVDKANVLESSRLWREIFHKVALDFPNVKTYDILVDNCAMQLVLNPSQFDVLVTENLFGDILSDEASVLTGSIGIIPSASLNESNFGLYEPIHGSAPDIAGKNIANPIATILSCAMMLKISFDMQKEGEDIENAVKKVIENGYRTADIMSENMTEVSCTKMGELICENM